MSYLNDWWRVFFGGMEYPYTDSCKYNDDWLLMVVKKLIEEFANFVNLNKIKYADPIGWDITRQYEANTVVVDNRTGNAYISTKSVPAGVQLSRTEYWTQIYNYSDIIETLEKNIAAYNEGESQTATRPYSAGDLVWISHTLYQVQSDIIAGDTFVNNSNVKKATVESLLGNLKSLTTDAKNSLVAAINEIIGIIGDLSDLATTAKTDIVSAINENTSSIKDLDTYVSNIGWGNVKDYGAVGDGVSDDTQAIQTCVNENLCVYFPAGEYLISSAIEIKSGSHLWGCNATIIHPSSRGVVGGTYDAVPDDTTKDIVIEGLTFNAKRTHQTAILMGNVNGLRISGVTTKGQESGSICTSISICDKSTNVIVENCNIYGADYALIFDTTPAYGLDVDAINRNITVSNCKITTNYGTCISLNAGARYVKISNCQLTIESTSGIGIKMLGKDVTQYANQHTENIEIVNVEIGGPAAPISTQGISFGHGATDITISNCRFANLVYGIYPNYLQAFPVLNVLGCIFKNCNGAIEMGGGANFLVARIEGCYFGSCVKAINSLLKNAAVEGNTFEKISGDAITMGNIHNVVIAGNVFEECHSACINFIGSGSNSNNNITVAHNQFFNCVDAANNTSTIILGNLIGTVIGNFINADSGQGYSPLYIIVTTNARLVVIGNTMRTKTTGYISSEPTIYANNLEF